MRSTLAGNKAPTSPVEGGDAGAILNAGSPTAAATLVIDSSTISGNTARLGGGITSGGNPDNTVTITNSTIAFNDSGNRGGGGGLLIGSGAVTVRNSIVARNTSQSVGQANCSTDPNVVIGSGGYNVENDTTCGFTSGTDRQNADPLLEPLAFNGGPTRTHAIPLGSPAVDTGDPQCPFADQRGFSRPLGRGCDSGAFEAVDQTVPETRIDSAPPAPSTDHTPTFTFSSDKPGSRFVCSLDSGPFADCASPFTTPRLDAGSHTFAVYAIDTAGRADLTPTVVDFIVLPVTVDELPPPKQGVSVNVAGGGGHGADRHSRGRCARRTRRRPIEPEGHQVRAAEPGGADPGRVVPRHDEGDGPAAERGEQGREAPDGQVPGAGCSRCGSRRSGARAG